MRLRAGPCSGKINGTEFQSIDSCMICCWTWQEITGVIIDKGTLAISTNFKRLDILSGCAAMAISIFSSSTSCMPIAASPVISFSSTLGCSKRNLSSIGGK